MPEHGGRGTTANPGYWSAKIAGNRRRDEDTDQRLAAAGWLPVRVWEHEPADGAAERIEAAVRARRALPASRTA